MRKKAIVVLMTIVFCIGLLTGCSSSYVGKWKAARMVKDKKEEYDKKYDKYMLFNADGTVEISIKTKDKEKFSQEKCDKEAEKETKNLEDRRWKSVSYDNVKGVLFYDKDDDVEEMEEEQRISYQYKDGKLEYVPDDVEWYYER